MYEHDLLLVNLLSQSLTSAMRLTNQSIYYNMKMTMMQVATHCLFEQSWLLVGSSYSAYIFFMVLLMVIGMVTNHPRVSRLAKDDSCVYTSLFFRVHSVILQKKKKCIQKHYFDFSLLSEAIRTLARCCLASCLHVLVLVLFVLARKLRDLVYGWHFVYRTHLLEILS